MENLRRLNRIGIIEFQNYILEIKAGNSSTIPTHLLTSDESSELIPELHVEKRNFESRFEFAEYIHSVFKNTDLKNIGKDVGLWSWLSLFYFDNICPLNEKNKRKVGEIGRYILNNNFQRYYRHLLAGPYNIYRAHLNNPHAAYIVLYSPLHKITDLIEQFASRKEIINNEALLDCLTKIYIDKKNGMPIKGCNNKKKGIGGLPGTIRRFELIWNQLDKVWDLDIFYKSENLDKFLDILPDEFNKFLKVNSLS